MSNSNNLVEGRITFKDRRPSWKNHGSGCASLNFSGHKAAKWFGITIMESGESSTKVTMVTLERDQLLELIQAGLKTLEVDDSLRAKIVKAAGQVREV